ncbi:MAG: DUF99 family protein [Acidobacteriota bacterium]|nr:DUF99 family protein [Acidobacteriota bacterium]
MRRHPRVLGIDDAPFEKGQREDVPIVAVVMEGSILVEGVAVGSFPVDGDGATDWVERWVRDMKWYSALQAVVLGGVTIAGLGLIHLGTLAARLERPVLSVTRRDTAPSDLANALETAGFPERVPVLATLPPARRLQGGLWLAHAGTDDDDAEALVRATMSRSNFPEALRIAHLIGAAIVRGESRGRA